MKIGEKIKKLRLENEMTLEELGQKVGVGKSTVRKWETGMITSMRFDKIIKLADVFHCSPSYLLGFEDNLTQNNAELLADILYDSDQEFLKYIHIIKNMNSQERQRLYGYIDSFYQRED